MNCTKSDQMLSINYHKTIKKTLFKPHIYGDILGNVFEFQ